MKGYETISYPEVKADLEAGKCKKIENFYVYPNKIVSPTDHYGFRIVKGTYDKIRGYVVTTPRSLARYSVAYLKARAFLIGDSKEKFFISFKDGNPANNNLDNLKVRYVRKKFCKHCGKKMKYDALHEYCLDCRMEYAEYSKTNDRELKRRKDLLKDIDIEALEEKQKERAKLYLEGWTLNAIAKKLNITRQAVEQSIKNIAKNDKEIKKTRRKIVKTEKEIQLLNSKIEKYQQKINQCQEELDMKQAYYNSLLEKTV
nr:MAG TPA: ECF sigma factor [Caudoviricetes sp.]